MGNENNVEILKEVKVAHSHHSTTDSKKAKGLRQVVDIGRNTVNNYVFIKRKDREIEIISPDYVVMVVRK